MAKEDAIFCFTIKNVFFPFFSNELDTIHPAAIFEAPEPKSQDAKPRV
jgi:hypothetical protein